MGHIEFDTRDRVGILTLSYKEENRFHPDFLNEMAAVLDEAERDDGVRALVVTGGEPKFFCNGLDLDWIMAHVSDQRAVLGYLASVNAMFRRWTLFPKPTVAGLNGHTFAAGLFMAAHMDFRLMRDDRGWICMPEVDIDLPLFPGMIAICRATMSESGFRRMYYTGARLTGPEAVEIGFVERAVSLEELLPACVELAELLAEKSTATYAEMKRRLRSEIVRILDEQDPEHFAKALSFAAV